MFCSRSSPDCCDRCHPASKQGHKRSGPSVDTCGTPFDNAKLNTPLHGFISPVIAARTFYNIKAKCRCNIPDALMGSCKSLKEDCTPVASDSIHTAWEPKLFVFNEKKENASCSAVRRFLSLPLLQLWSKSLSMRGSTWTFGQEC